MMAPPLPTVRPHDNGPSLGIYTKTVVSSSVVHWILPAHIRHSAYNDVVFVGEDFIQVKEVEDEGQLKDIATKANFDARIIAAAVFTNIDDDEEVDFLDQIKQEASQNGLVPQPPPQSVVLTLDSNNLVFVTMVANEQGLPKFIESPVPIPRFDRTLFQPGEHLAVDPFSRAIAVAAREGQVMVCGAKPKAQWKYELENLDKRSASSPIANTRLLKVDGVIQQMDFLIPPTNLSDQVILLLIIIDQGRTKAVRFDWSFSSGPRNAQHHPGQLLSESKTIPNLLIPLLDASFLLITGYQITRWKDIMTGCATDLTLRSPSDPPRYPGLSSRLPAWASWAKPRRNKTALRDRDEMYLVREDGMAFLMYIDVRGSVQMSPAGNLNCHVGTAFASLGDEEGADVLAICGETCSGRVISIGHFRTNRIIEEMTREETMQFDTVQLLPNWASTTDMISVKQLNANRHKAAHTDNVLVTSGRQPYGTVTEIRRGLEGPITVTLDIGQSKHVTDIWAVPDPCTGRLLFVLSSPFGTRVMYSTGEFDEAGEISASNTFELSKSTLSAGITAKSQLVQVTSQGFCVTSTLEGNFEDTWRKSLEGDSAVIAADLVEDVSLLVTAEQDEDNHSISCYSLPSPEDETGIQLKASIPLPSKPLCVSATSSKDGVVTMTTTVDGKVALIFFSNTAAEPVVYAEALPLFGQSPSVCDHIAILQCQDEQDGSTKLRGACGLRDGRLVIYSINLQSKPYLTGEKIITFGDSTVKLVPLPSDKSSAYALSGSSLCLLSCAGMRISMENIWLVNKTMPELAQPTVLACAQTPSAMWLSSQVMAECLVLVTDLDQFIATKVERTPKNVSRQVPVDGTPNRLIYAGSLRNIVCASVFAEVRTFPSSKPHAPPLEKRQTWPVISFIADQDNEPSFKYSMQPGDRINALLEWTTTNEGTGKVYTNILAGGKHMHNGNVVRGRVTVLQQSLRDWQVVSVVERYKLNFDDEVYALALYESNTIVVCYGEYVDLRRYDGDEGRWREPCQGRPYKLGSPGCRVTIEAGTDGDKTIHVSTARDSMIVLRLTEDDHGAQLDPVAMGPRAQSLMCHQNLSHPGHRNLALLASKTGAVSGMTWSTQNKTQSHHTTSPSKIFCKAQLPRSLTRMIPSTPPARKGSPPEGVLSKRTIGCATDGALVGIVMLEPQLWRRLWWLQRLIEWSADLSPSVLYKEPKAYDPVRKNSTAGSDRTLPIGLAEGSQEAVPMQTVREREQDLHIDGDVLARILQSGGVAAVKKTLEDLVKENESPAGRWVKEHLEEEFEALSEVVGIVRDLTAWI